MSILTQEAQKMQEWVVDQALGAGSYQNLPASIDKKIAFLKGATPDISESAVESAVNAEIDTIVGQLMPSGVGGIASGIIEGWLTRVADEEITKAYPAIAADADKAASVVNDKAPALENDLENPNA